MLSFGSVGVVVMNGIAAGSDARVRAAGYCTTVHAVADWRLARVPPPETTLIESPLALSAFILAVAAIAFLLDRHVKVLSRVGAAVIAILMAAVASNLGLVAPTSPVYDIVVGPVTSLAIAWLLLSVNLADIRKVGGKVLAAFGLALAGTVLGAIVGGLVFAGTFGDETWKLAGTLTGTYTGGSLNFVAVSRGTGLADSLFAGTTAADNVATTLWLGATLLIPVWFAKFYPPIPAEHRYTAGAHGVVAASTEPGTESLAAAAPSGGIETEAHPYFAPASISTLDLAVLGATGILLILLSDAVATVVPAIPSVLWLTTFALLAGHLTPLGRVPGAFQLGNFALVLFFVIIGIFSRIAEIISVGVAVLWFTLIVVGIHGLVVFGFGRLLRIDVASLSVASQAAVGGPSSALAVAVAREWPALVLPGIIVGLLGYAVGNYLGFAVAAIVRAAGGG